MTMKRACYFHNDKRTGCPLCNRVKKRYSYPPPLPAGSDWPPHKNRPLGERNS